jgi:hypothetical protein
VRAIADKSLIVISLELYSVVSRLFDYSLRNNSPRLKLADMEIQVFREDVKSLYLDAQFKNVSYHFNFPNNGWLSIKENAEGIQTERFSMGFFRDDHNFTFTGDRDFCLEICDRLISNIKTTYHLK